MIVYILLMGSYFFKFVSAVMSSAYYMLLNILQFGHHTTWHGPKQLRKYLLLKASWLFINLAYVANFFKNKFLQALCCYLLLEATSHFVQF